MFCTFIPKNTNQYGSSPRTITSSDVDYFEISESGPVKVVIMAEGKWSEENGASLCDIASGPSYESFTYSLALTFFRNRSDIKVQVCLFC